MNGHSVLIIDQYLVIGKRQNLWYQERWRLFKICGKILEDLNLPLLLKIPETPHRISLTLRCTSGGCHPSIKVLLKFWKTDIPFWFYRVLILVFLDFLRNLTSAKSNVVYRGLYSYRQQYVSSQGSKRCGLTRHSGVIL